MHIKADDFLKKETTEEKNLRLEKELKLEKEAHKNTTKFFEDELKRVSSAFLDMCDNGLCKGDHSVGIQACPFWTEEKYTCYCLLKRYTGKE